MSVVIFKALIAGVHYDPKKGALKIQLIAASPVSIDKLTTLAPSDEPINIVLECAQTKISDVGAPTTLESEHTKLDYYPEEYIERKEEEEKKEQERMAAEAKSPEERHVDKDVRDEVEEGGQGGIV